MGESNNEKQKGRDRKNALEWAVFGTGLLLITGVLGYWFHQAFNVKPSPPDLYVERSYAPTAKSPNRYRVVVYNNGGQTAESAMVEVSLQRSGKVLETAQLPIAYVPNASKREGWVNFSTDPAKADTVVARVMSYRNP